MLCRCLAAGKPSPEAPNQLLAAEITAGRQANVQLHLLERQLPGKAERECVVESGDFHMTWPEDLQDSALPPTCLLTEGVGILTFEVGMTHPCRAMPVETT